MIVTRRRFITAVIAAMAGTVLAKMPLAGPGPISLIEVIRRRRYEALAGLVMINETWLFDQPNNRVVRHLEVFDPYGESGPMMKLSESYDADPEDMQLPLGPLHLFGPNHPILDS